MPGRRAKKEKVPSVFVFVSAEAAVAFSSKKTEASATRFPAESRTVPDTVITERGSAAGVCAKLNPDAAQKLNSDMVAAQDRNILRALIRKELIAGILLTRGRLARMGLG